MTEGNKRVTLRTEGVVRETLDPYLELEKIWGGCRGSSHRLRIIRDLFVIL